MSWSRAIAASMAAACASTSSGRWSTTALMDGLTASSRASAAEAASFAETFFDLIRAAISAADRRQSSSIVNSSNLNARLVAPPTAWRHRETAASNGSADPGEKIGQICDLLGRHRLQHFGHGAVVAVAAVVLVFPHGLGEVVLALVGEARDVVFAGKIRVVAGIAAMLLDQRLRALQPRGIAGIGGRSRLRQFADKIGKGAEIVVGERLGDLVHRLENPELLAKHE